MTACTLFALLPQPRVHGYTDMTSPRILVHGRRVKKRAIVYGTPDFLDVVGACACTGSTRLFLLPLPRRAWVLG